MRARSGSMLGLLVGGVIATLIIRLVKGHTDAPGPHDRYRPQPPDRDDPRWGPDDGRVQIAGKACAECSDRITLAFEGAACDLCRQPCHTKCIARHVARDHNPNDDGTPYR